MLFLGLLVDDTLVLFVETQSPPFKSLPPLPNHQTNPHARILTFDTCSLDILDQSDILKPH